MWHISRLLSKSRIGSFCTSNKFGKDLTKKIMMTSSPQQLQLVVSRYMGSFNLLNITALLKKINKQTIQKPNIKEVVFGEVRRTLIQAGQPNTNNARGIANIIGYTGNLECSNINDLLMEINFQKLFTFLNSKEFVMALTGLIKLNIAQKCIKFESIQSLVLRSVNQEYPMGLVVSVWRNLIKSQLSTPKLNQHLSRLIEKKPVNNNLKDYGYLVYCYLETLGKKDMKESKTEESEIKDQQKTEKSEDNNILTLLEKYPSNIMYSTRINIYELCNIMEYVAKLSGHTSEESGKHLQQLFLQHYYRNICMPRLDLRSIANGYYSLLKLFQKPPLQIYEKTGKIFTQILKKQSHQIKDYESVVSLFIHLTATSPSTTVKNELYNEFSIQDLIKPILHFIFNPKQKNIHSLSNKQFQKLLYGFYSYANRFSEFQLGEENKQEIYEQVRVRNLNDFQIISVVGFLPLLKMADQSICRYISHRFSEMGPEMSKNHLSRKCILGLDFDKCLKCGNRSI